MIELRPFDSLGAFRNDWLNARHHFSFGNYFDPKRLSWGKLRVWNDDIIDAGTGFAPHGHRDMEIITYVRKGAISHRDNQGNAGRTEAGDVQVMWAGNGIVHEEMNHESEDTEIFQIWIETAQPGIDPGWEARSFPKEERAGELVVLASGRPGDTDAAPIHQDAAILAATLKAGQSVTHSLGSGRHAYLVAATGAVDVANDSAEAVKASARDGVAIRDVDLVTVTATEDAEILIADVPA